MNFDGLADSVTNLVGALILVLVLVIGITDEAGSQPPVPPVAPQPDPPSVDPFRGDRTLPTLENRVAILRSRLQTSDQDVTRLRSRLGELQEQVKDLLDQVQSVQPADDKNAEKPPEPSKVKDVRYRPPFERGTKKDSDLALVLENNRVAIMDLGELGKKFKDRSFDVGTRVVKADTGDFDFEETVIDLVFQKMRQIKLQRKSGHLGETLAQLDSPDSQVMARLKSLNPTDGRGLPGSDGKTAAGRPTGNQEVVSASGSDDAASNSASQTTGDTGAKRGKAETADNDSPVAQTRADENVLEVEVMLAMIDGLLGQENAERALAQAETWQWILHGQTVSEDEARAVRLKEVIALLVERLTPKPQPPAPAIAVFQKLLAELRQAITDEKLDQARELNRTAERQFEQHAQDLAPYSRNLAALRSRLKQLERKVDGLRQIEQGLQQAKGLFQQEQVTQALEMKSRAEFAALHHYDMPEADRSRLTQLAAELREPQRLAVGRRAVADAKKCQIEGDQDARDQQMQVALAVLPGLPDSQVRGLIESVNELEKNKGTLKAAQSTALGQRLTARKRYERALELLAGGNTSELIAEGRAIGRAEGSVSDSEARRWNEQTTEVLFDAVAPLVRDLTEGAIGREQLATEIRAASDALASLEPWKSHSRWRALSVELEQFVRQTCREVLSRATKFAAQGNPERAVATWTPVLEVCSSDIKAEADKLHRNWTTELELRAGRKAEAEHWSRIQQLAGRESEPAFALARELQTFRQRYPASEHTDEASRIETQPRPRLLADIDRVAARADKAWQAKQWSAFREAARELARRLRTATPLPEALRRPTRGLRRVPRRR